MKKILKKQVQYRKFEDCAKEKIIFLYDKKGKQQSIKTFSDGKLDQSAKYLYNRSKKLSEIQITFHRANRKEFIFYAYDKFGRLKEARICSDTPDNLLYRSEYTFIDKNYYFANAKSFDVKGNLLKEEKSICPMDFINIYIPYPYKDFSRLEEYKHFEKIQPENYKLYPIKYFRNKKSIKIKEYGDNIKIVADKDNNTKKYYKKSDMDFLLVKKYYW